MESPTPALPDSEKPGLFRVKLLKVGMWRLWLVKCLLGKKKVKVSLCVLAKFSSISQSPRPISNSVCTLKPGFHVVVLGLRWSFRVVYGLCCLGCFVSLSGFNLVASI